MDYNLRNKLLQSFRKKLKNEYVTSGWMQICSPEIAEILSQKNFDAITLDFEHGSFDISRLNDIFRAIENSRKISLVRLQNHNTENLGRIFDAGCSGIIIPNIVNVKQLKKIAQYCYWPPKGIRGVGFSRANLYGKHFKNYRSNNPLIIAMIENVASLSNLEEILNLKELDGILIGPYDLSASIGKPGNFENKKFKSSLKEILVKCKKFKKPVGIHVVEPSVNLLNKRIKEGYKFLPFGIDTVFINNSLNIKF